MQHSIRVLTFYLLRSGLASPVAWMLYFRLIVLKSFLIVSHDMIILSPLSLHLPLNLSLLINFCTWQMLIAITGFYSFFTVRPNIENPQQPYLSALKDRPPIHNSAHIGFIAGDANFLFSSIYENCFLFYGSNFEDKSNKTSRHFCFVW